MFKSSFFDARVVEVTSDGHVVLDHHGSLHKVRLADGQQIVTGQIGHALCINRDLETFVFRPYVDQSLRRKPELDRSTKPTAQKIRLSVYGTEVGWMNSRHPKGFRAPLEVTPGLDGEFEPIQCQLLRLDVPREFISFCRQFESTPEALLKGFIADTLQLQSCKEKPRADLYQLHASYAFDAVWAYLDRAYGWKKEQPQ
ncbi:MAG: hypothetical protein ACOH2R_16225 [Pseudomonas sp.]